jgi:Spy/CpxP family protein refolding chaperone
MNEFNGRLKAVLSALALLLLMIFTPALTVRAQDESGVPPQRETEQGPGDHEDRFQGLRERLNLSPDQIEQIKAIREQNREQWRAARQRLRQAQRALDEAIYADSVDEATVEARTREVAEAQTALLRMRALTELKIRRVLTEAQLNTLRSLRQQRAAEREQRMQEGTDRPLRRPLRRGQRP